MHTTTHNTPPLNLSSHLNGHKDTHLYSRAVPGLGLYCWPCVHSAEYTVGSVWRSEKPCVHVCVSVYVGVWIHGCGNGLKAAS